MYPFSLIGDAIRRSLEESRRKTSATRLQRIEAELAETAAAERLTEARARRDGAVLDIPGWKEQQQAEAAVRSAQEELRRHAQQTRQSGPLGGWTP